MLEPMGEERPVDGGDAESVGTVLPATVPESAAGSWHKLESGRMLRCGKNCTRKLCMMHDAHCA